MPIAGLTLSGSTLYGTTFYGGYFSNGVIFKIETNGNDFAVLRHSPPLVGGTNSDGASLYAGLTLAADTLYGAAVNGGNFGSGTLFRMKTNGTDYVVLKHYLWDDGAFPKVAPTINGRTLYGLAVAGGANRYGILFRVNTDGSGYTVFRNLSDYSYSRLLLSEGALFGTISSGGSQGKGLVFAFDISPVLSAVSSSGFSFNVSGVSNQTVVIETSSTPGTGIWTPLQTNVLGDVPLSVLHPPATNIWSQFYRARKQ